MIFKYECSSEEWQKAIEAMRSGEIVEIDEEFYWYFLEVLPPVFMNKRIDGKFYDFGFAEGCENIRLFWRECGEDKYRYYCKQSNIVNPYG